MAANVQLRTTRGFDDSGVRRRVIATYTGPASYVTGGESVTGNDFKMGQIELFQPEVAVDNAGGFRMLVYDYTNKKVVWFRTTGTQVTNGTDLSTFSARVEVIGY